MAVGRGGARSCGRSVFAPTGGRTSSMITLNGSVLWTAVFVTSVRFKGKHPNNCVKIAAGLMKSFCKRINHLPGGGGVCVGGVHPSSSPDSAFRSLMYGLSLRIRSIRCFWSGKMSYSFLFSSDVSPAVRCGGGEGEGEGEGERRGGCHCGGPEWGQ